MKKSNSNKIITIDGPAASGKSSTAQAVAQALNAYYINSGLLYRALAYQLAQNNGGDYPYHKPSVSDINQAGKEISYHYSSQDGARVYVQQQDITARIRSQEMSEAASVLSTHELVRTWATNKQREYAANADNMVIAEGRDAASVVFPHAQVKFFLTASLHERARRYVQAQAGKLSIAEAEELLAKRDERDTTRTHHPLVRVADAITVDNSGMSMEQTVQLLITLIHNAIMS